MSRPRSTIAPGPRRSRSGVGRLAHLVALATLAASPLAAQDSGASYESNGAVAVESAPAPSAASLRARRNAERAKGLRIVVSLDERRLWVLSDRDTLMEAPVAVGTGGRISYLQRSWTFDTPLGVRTVLRKKTDPVWTPPDWAYVEVAQEHGLRLEHLSARRPRVLADGRKLAVRGGLVYLDDLDGSTQPMNLEEHIVFDETLFVPPTSTRNRRIEGELGRYALDTGNGYMLHGTPYTDTIGQKASHGCLRLRDEDIAWLYEFVPVGTKVFLY
jgi:lipoprotein-anchoring transpeptidase ErfK/SrfK